MVDPTRLITLRDDDIIPGGGLAAEMNVNLSANPTDGFNFGNRVAAQPAELYEFRSFPKLLF